MKTHARTGWMLVAVAGCGMLGFVAPPPLSEPKADSPKAESTTQPERGPRGERGPDADRGGRPGDSEGRGRLGAWQERYENMEPEQLRARLEQRLDFVKRQERQITQALAVLDKGGEVAEAARVAREGGGDEPTKVPMGAKLSDSDRERIMALIAEHMPDLHARLTALQAENPEAATEMLERMGGMLLDVVRTKLADDTLGTARLEELRASWGVLDAVHRVRIAFEQGGETAAMELKPELARAISAQLMAKANLANIELQRLREQVAELETRAGESRDLHADKINEMADRLTQRVVLRAKDPSRPREPVDGPGERPNDRPRRPATTSTPNGG